MVMCRICVKAQETRLGWNGAIVVMFEGKPIWGEMSPITRVTRQDALEDAQQMVRDLETIAGDRP
jgi:hypothetical protein